MKRIVPLMLLVICGSSFSQTNPADSNRKPVQHSVSVQKQQLVGKWDIAKVVTPKHQELPPEKVRGSYFVFNDDGTYNTLILGVDEAGTWNLGPESKNIHMFVRGYKNVWNILSYSENELILQKGIRGNTVTFTR